MTNTVLTVLKIWAAVLIRPHSKVLKTSSAEEAVFPTCSKAYSAEEALEDSAGSVHRAAVRHEAVALHGERIFGMTCRSTLPTPYTARRLKYSIHAMNIVRSARAPEAPAGGRRCAPLQGYRTGTAEHRLFLHCKYVPALRRLGYHYRKPVQKMRRLRLRAEKAKNYHHDSRRCRRRKAYHHSQTGECRFRRRRLRRPLRIHLY